ncbi:MAG: D-inositol-3-phosphate glycosyltransferase [Desulfovibrio sp.]
MNRTVCFCNGNRAWGGGEKWHLEAALGLARRGCRVFLMAAEGAPLCERASAHSELTVIPKRFSNLDFLNPFTLNSCAAFFKKERVERVILGLPLDMKVAGVAAKKAGVPGIFYRRGSAVPVKNTRFNRYLYRDVLTGLIVNSHETARLVFAGGDVIDPKKVHVLYNGIDVEAFDAALAAASPFPQIKRGNLPVIGNAGRLTAQKGQQYLLHMSRALLDAGVGHILAVAGDGERREELQKLATGLSLDGTAVFTGFLSDMAPFWRSVDYFVLSSLWEGFGYVLAEGMLAGKPVVAFDGNSMPEIVRHGETGALVPMPGAGESPEAVGKRLAKTVQGLIEQKEAAARLAANGREFCRETFGQEASIKRLLALLWPENTTEL